LKKISLKKPTPKFSRSDLNALKALREGVKQALEERRKSGVSFSIWKNGKLVTVPAKKITAALLRKL